MPWEINSFGPKWNISLPCFISFSIHINIIAFNWIVFVIRVRKGGILSKEIDCKANCWDSIWEHAFSSCHKETWPQEIQPWESPDNSFLLTVESTTFMIKAYTPPYLKHFVNIQIHALKNRALTKGHEKKWVNSYIILEVEEAFLGLISKAESKEQMTATYNYTDT